MNDFDPIAEIKKNKVPLIVMSLAIFVVTFIIVLIGKSDAGSGNRKELPSSQTPVSGKGIILDYSDPQLPEDRLDMPQPIIFFTRGPGTNRLHYDRVQYALDDAGFDEPIRIREKR
ncbi:MAG: hypothetical protein LBC99_01305 [Spirochaetota bacterium]|jgi:hypothetical protein|nr:hypothetical protein [Spirochaetota bacterium]